MIFCVITIYLVPSDSEAAILNKRIEVGRSSLSPHPDPLPLGEGDKPHFLIKKFSITSKSNPLLLNVRKAFAGVDTIGSPRKL
jgi:hypothetical protein